MTVGCVCVCVGDSVMWCLSIEKECLNTTLLNNWIWCIDVGREGGGGVCLRKQRWVKLHVGDAFGSLHWVPPALSAQLTDLPSHDWKSSPSRHRLFGCHAGPAPQSGSAFVWGLHRLWHVAFSDTCRRAGLGGGILLSPVLIEAGS